MQFIIIQFPQPPVLPSPLRAKYNSPNTLFWGSVVVKALRYKSVGPGIDSKR